MWAATGRIIVEKLSAPLYHYTVKRSCNAIFNLSIILCPWNRIESQFKELLSHSNLFIQLFVCIFVYLITCLFGHSPIDLYYSSEYSFIFHLCSVFEIFGPSILGVSTAEEIEEFVQSVFPDTMLLRDVVLEDFEKTYVFQEGVDNRVW